MTGNEITIDFLDCELTDVLLDGAIETAQGNPFIGLDLTDPGNDESISVEGTPGAVGSDSGVVFDGILDASPDLR